MILVYLGGGLSHLDSFDPKPDAPAEIRGKYRPIETSVPGVILAEVLPRVSCSMDKLALVRSFAHDCDHHEAAANWLLSGRFGSPYGDHPALGAVVADELKDRGPLPPYVSVPGNPSCTWELGKSAFLGPRCESFASQLIDGNDPSTTFDDSQSRTARRSLSSEARQAFDIERENIKTRDRYGWTEFGQNSLLARRLVEHGVRFVTVNFGGWDHHTNIWQSLQQRLPQFDRGFSALIDDLQIRGLLDETLVVACSEFGRCPRINADGGRDHWPAAGSLLFAGAGVQAGQVIGATDFHGAEVTDRPISPSDVAYTIYHALGIDPRKQLAPPDGRKQAILDQGRVIDSLLRA